MDLQRAVLLLDGEQFVVGEGGLQPLVAFFDQRPPAFADLDCFEGEAPGVRTQAVDEATAVARVKFPHASSIMRCSRWSLASGQCCSLRTRLDSTLHRTAREITVAQLDARPLLIVISGPSGAGKGTALDHATRTLPLRRIPTYTTRPMRSGERNGIDYEYVDEEKFLQLREAGVIFEYTRTYSRSYYGSPSALLHDDIRDPLIVELDPNGFVRVRAASARRVVGIFVATSSEAELRARLAARAQDFDIGQRLKIRTDQMTWAWIYDYVVFNEDREQFLNGLTAIIESELLRTSGAKRMLDLRQEMDLTLKEAE